LRQAPPQETHQLMVLADDVEAAGSIEHLEKLARQFEAGRHHLQENLELDNPETAQQVANEMAEDLRVLNSHTSELQSQPVTEERLQQAKEMFQRYGVDLPLPDLATNLNEINFN